MTEMESVDAEQLIPALHQIGSGAHPTTSVLICDDRPTVGRQLSQTFQRFLPSIGPVDTRLVADGFTLVDAFARAAADLVLIGIHAATTTGIDAINLLFGIHPRASTVVYGSVTDIELLAAAYARGAGGLLVWEPSGTLRVVNQTPQAG